MERKLEIIKSWISRKLVLLPVLAISLLLLMAAVYWFVQQNNWLKEDYSKQTELSLYQENYRDVIYYLQKADADVRGYAFTRNKNFVADFKDLSDSLQKSYEEIKFYENKEVAVLNSELTEHFDNLILEKKTRIDQIKSLCDSGKWDGAALLIDTDRGMYLADSIYLISQIIKMEEHLQKAQSKTTYSVTQKNNANIAYIGIICAVLILLIVVFLLRRQIKHSTQLNTELSIQKEFFKTTVNSLGEGLIATSKYGEIVFMNPAAEKLTGWSFDDAKFKKLSTIYQVFNEETGLQFDNIVHRIIEKGAAVQLENNTLLKSRNNDYLVISNNGSPMLDGNGNVTGALLVFNDITEKKKNEIELKESEKRFRNLIENLPEAVYTCDELGYIQIYNRAAVKLWGREPTAGKELWAGSWKILDLDGIELAPDNIPMAVAIKEGRPVLGKELLVVRPDGTKRHVLPSPTPLYNNNGKIIGAVNMLLDITNKKEREVLIQKTEEKYRALFEQGNDAIVTYSFDGSIHEFNDIICTMSGYTREEFSKLKVNDIIVGDLIISTEKYNAILAGEMVTIFRQCRRKDGGLVDMEFKTKMNSEGIIVAFGRDITERKKNEEQIKTAIERYEILSEATSDTIWDWNMLADTITYNRGITTMFGYRLSQIKDPAEWWQEKIHPDDNTKVNKRLTELFKTKAQNIQLEYLYRCADNSYKNIKDRAFVVYNDEGKPIRMVGAMQDITLEKAHERQIGLAVIDAQENERRELGMELHDNVNQLLSATLLYLGMAGKASKQGKEVSETLNECTGYINSAITDIRNLSHRLTPFTTEEVELKDIIEWLTVPMQKAGQFNVDVQISEEADQLITTDIKTNFYRIIQEQLNNIGKHAKAEKVEIVINVVDKKLQLSIMDDGIGFDPDSVKRGIGLQNIKRRAEIFFGEFMLHSSPGKGCQLLITQPIN